MVARKSRNTLSEYWVTFKRVGHRLWKTLLYISGNRQAGAPRSPWLFLLPLEDAAGSARD